MKKSSLSDWKTRFFSCSCFICKSRPSSFMHLICFPLVNRRQWVDRRPRGAAGLWSHSQTIWPAAMGQAVWVHHPTGQGGLPYAGISWKTLSVPHCEEESGKFLPLVQCLTNWVLCKHVTALISSLQPHCLEVIKGHRWIEMYWVFKVQGCTILKARHLGWMITLISIRIGVAKKIF